MKQTFIVNGIDILKQNDELKQENGKLKEEIIKLTEENGNLIINRNTLENKLQDTESRLIYVQKANTHNLVLLQRRNNTLEEINTIIKQIKKEYSIISKFEEIVKIEKIIKEVLK